MATPLGIFDRDNAVRAINNDCLSQTGRGTVILSAQKSGKSHLLKHVYSLRSAKEGAIFCWINMDYMLGKAASDRKLTDGDLLRFTLDRLEEGLQPAILEASQNEQSWKEEWQRTRNERAAAAANPTLAAELQKKLTSLQKPLNDLNALRLIADRIRFRDEKANDTDLLLLFDDCLEALKRIQKRVVLFIDDFQHVLKHVDFSLALKRTLRGANSDGKLVLLLASPVRLLDPSLGQGVQNAFTLFNDLKSLVLEGFTLEESKKFIQWISQNDQALESEEIEYLCELGGGSPHFLQIAHDQFMVSNRPKSPEERKAFEQKALYPAFETGFVEIWNRCTVEQRTRCRALVKAGGAVQLEYDLGAADCFLSCVVGSPKLSRVAADFISRQADEEAPSLKIVTVPNFSSFPSALSLAKPESEQPLVVFQLRNTTDKPYEVYLSCELQQFSLPVETTVTIGPYESRAEPMTVTLSAQKAAALQQAESTQIKVTYDLIGSGKKPFSKTYPIRILERDYFVFARRHQAENFVVNYSWLIAAWVRQNDPEVAKIRAEAAKSIGGMPGYPKASGPAAAEIVRKQARALYDVLRTKPLSYGNRTVPAFQELNHFGQSVRLPGRSIADNMMNCIDGAVLYGSLLASCDLDPGILFIPGHAMAGWKHSASAMSDWEFVEITEITDSDFDTANRHGQERFQSIGGVIEVANDDRIQIRDLTSFAILVDIRRVWACGVNCLP